MNGSRYTTYVVVLVVLLTSIVGLAIFSRSFMSAKVKRAQQEENDQLCSQLCDKDVSLYWIGSIPDELSSVMSKIVIPESITSEFLPVKSPEFHITERDPDGNIVSERVPVEYPSKLYIVINRTVLSDEQYSAVRDCIVENGVTALVIGSDAIDGFRDFMIMPVKLYSDNDILEYSFEDGKAEFTDNKDVGGTPFELIRFLLEDMSEDGDRS